MEEKTYFPDYHPNTAISIIFLKKLEANDICYEIRENDLDMHEVEGVVQELYIDAKKYKNAVSLFNTLSWEVMSRKPFQCPKCESINISSSKHGGLLGFFQKEIFLCDSCKFEWNPRSMR